MTAPDTLVRRDRARRFLEGCGDPVIPGGCQHGVGCARPPVLQWKCGPHWYRMCAGHLLFNLQNTRQEFYANDLALLEGEEPLP